MEESTQFLKLSVASWKIPARTCWLNFSGRNQPGWNDQNSHPAGPCGDVLFKSVLRSYSFGRRHIGSLLMLSISATASTVSPVLSDNATPAAQSTVDAAPPSLRTAARRAAVAGA